MGSPPPQPPWFWNTLQFHQGITGSTSPEKEHRKCDAKTVPSSIQGTSAFERTPRASETPTTTPHIQIINSSHPQNELERISIESRHNQELTCVQKLVLATRVSVRLPGRTG